MPRCLVTGSAGPRLCSMHHAQVRNSSMLQQLRTLPTELHMAHRRDGRILIASLHARMHIHVSILFGAAARAAMVKRRKGGVGGGAVWTWAAWRRRRARRPRARATAAARFPAVCAFSRPRGATRALRRSLRASRASARQRGRNRRWCTRARQARATWAQACASGGPSTSRGKALPSRRQVRRRPRCRPRGALAPRRPTHARSAPQSASSSDGRRRAPWGQVRAQGRAARRSPFSGGMA